MDFEDRDVRSDPTYLRELVALGSRSTPTTIVESEAGKEMMMGFDQTRLRALLGL